MPPGVEDLIAGRVRFIGDARARIAEDYLRVLRLFRFHAWYGKGEIDARRRCARRPKPRASSRPCRRNASPRNCCVCWKPAIRRPVLRVMAATGILSELLPGALQLPRLEKSDADRCGKSLSAVTRVLRLAALLPDDGAPRGGGCLKLSNAASHRLEQVLGGERIAAQLSAREARRLLYRLGAARFRDKVMLQWAGAPQAAGGLAHAAGKWRDNWQRPRFRLDRARCDAAGVPEGPQVGRVLAQVEDWWMEGDFAAERRRLARPAQGLGRSRPADMTFRALGISLSLPGDPAKANEDAFGHDEAARCGDRRRHAAGR